MHTIDIFQFAKLRQENFLPFLDKASKNKTSLIFDLEDSIQNLDHPCATAGKKATQRKLLGELLNAHYADLQGKSIGVRINALNSDEFNLDILSLQQLKSGIGLDCIVVPKFEQYRDMQRIMDILNQHRINFMEIIPVIETLDGLRNLTEILKERPWPKFKRVIFGHCDFNLSLGHFPFHHSDSPLYWQWVTTIVSSVEKTGYEYINTAFLRLTDDDGLRTLVSALSTLCKGRFGQATLNTRQSSICNQLCQTDMPPVPFRALIVKRRLMESEKYTCALETIRLYRQSNKEGMGFTVIPGDQRLISPHEYLAAKRYLKEHEYADTRTTV